MLCAYIAYNLKSFWDRGGAHGGAQVAEMDDDALAWTCAAVQFVVGNIIFWRAWRCIGPVRKALIRQAATSRQEYLTTTKVGDPPTLRYALALDDRVQPVLERAKQEKLALNTFRRTLAVGVFVSHVRAEANFVRSNVGELELPPAPTLERAPRVKTPLIFTYMMFRNPGTRNMLVNAFGMAIIMGAFVPLVWLAKMHGSDSVESDIVGVLQNKIKVARGGFSFLVAFLLLGLLNFVVARWREYLVTCQKVQSSLQNLGLAIGAAVVDGGDEEIHRRLFQICECSCPAHTHASSLVRGSCCKRAPTASETVVCVARAAHPSGVAMLAR